MSTGVGDFFDISTERVPNPELSERPPWPSKDAHLKNDSPLDEVEFLPALPCVPATFRDKFSAKLVKAIEDYEKTSSVMSSNDARVQEKQHGAQHHCVGDVVTLVPEKSDNANSEPSFG